MTFASDDLSLIGLIDPVVLRCTSILSMLPSEMRDISDKFTINFLEGKYSEMASLEDGRVINTNPDSEVVIIDLLYCAEDVITFVTEFDVVDYSITPAAEVKTVQPSIM